MPTNTQNDQQLEELVQLREIVEGIGESIDHEIHKPFWKTALSEFTSGIIRGVGLVIGTTIVAALIIYTLQALVNWSDLQSNITDWITQTTQEGISDALPNEISSFLQR